MKILEINKFYFIKGGAEKHFFDVVDLLESKNNEVAVFSMQHPKNKKSQWDKYFISTAGYTSEYSLWQKIKGVFRMFYSFEAKKNIRKLLDDFSPDIVHIHNAYNQISYSILSEIKKRKIPIIMTVHDYDFFSPDREVYYDKIKNKYYKFIFYPKYNFFKRILLVVKLYFYHFFNFISMIDFFIAPSEFVKGVVLSAGVSEKKVFSVPHFALGDFKCDESRKDSEEKYALYQGRISKEKGVNDLINIFKNTPGIKLYLAGDIEEDIRLKESEHVRYLGFLEQDELKKYIQNSEFIISGSKLPETFGLIALEAIVKGKPFIGFRTGAYEEIIKSGENGYLVKNNEEMTRIVNKIIKGGTNFNKEEIYRKALGEYSPDRYYEKLLKIIKKNEK